MNLQLENKLALVSGSTAGIGFAIAKALAAEGARVIVNGRTDARVTEALASIRADIPSAKLEALAVDLSKADAAAEATKRYPDVDILVNNLGVYQLKDFEQITDAEWSAIIETNFLSGVRLSRHYLPRMKAAGWGRIGGDDPLRRNENDAGSAGSRTGRNHRANRRDGEFGTSRPDSLGRRGKIYRRHGENEKRYDR